MTEKTESMEIYPMRGHSRGDWYGSLDDIARAEDRVEYWAIFGVTHRGNKHCLGEFPTREAAEHAMRGWKSIRRPAQTPKPRRASQLPRPKDVSLTKKHDEDVVQFEVIRDRKDDSKISVVALCGNGTIWRRDTETRSDAGATVSPWQQLSLDGIEHLSPEQAFRVVLARSQ